MRYGTSHFVSKAAAARYYEGQGFENGAAAVEEKLGAGEIFIGKPALKPGEKIAIIRGEGRYEIHEAEKEAKS